MAYSREAQKRYRKKGLQFSVNYRQTDVTEGVKLKKYLDVSGETANMYLKQLIKQDLDSKCITVTEEDIKLYLKESED